MVRLSFTAPPVCAAVAAAFFLGTAAAAGAATPQTRDFERQIAIGATAGDAAPANAGGHRHGSARAASAHHRVVTLRSRATFHMVGFRWRGSGEPALRVRSFDGVRWSAWVEVAAAQSERPDSTGPLREGADSGVSVPVWTGRATRLQVAVGGRGFVGLKAHFVKVAQRDSSGSPSGRLARVSGTGGTPPVAPVAPSQPASQETGRGADTPIAPPIITRTQWGADTYCKPRVKPSYGEVLGTVVHHTVSTNAYSRAEAASVVLGICRFHRNSNKWNDVGYNLLVDRFGNVYEGRAGGADRAVVGAHSQGFNGQTSGIALLGTFTSARAPQAALSAVQAAVKWKLALAGVSRSERVALNSTGGAQNRYKNGRLVFARPVSGHRDLGSTTCPGNGVYPKLPSFQSYLTPGSRAATRMSLRLKRVGLPDGSQTVAISGRLRSGGRAVAGELVEIQNHTSAGWVKLAETRTNVNGVWETQLAPAERVYLRGMYAGDSNRRAVRSNWLYSPKLANGPTGPSGAKR
ncbi:MAG: N-acetylmuramoyl-L-alanine amidase [Solirubrobacterales bacterium]